MDRLVAEVLGQENVINDAVAVVFFARALVDTPVAIDDKLCRQQSAWQAFARARGVGRGTQTLYCVRVLGKSTVLLKTPPSFWSFIVLFQSSKVPVT